MKSLRKNNKGISLIEIIVTVAIMAIVVVPLVSGFFTAMEINSDSRRIQNASNIAQDVMEIVKAKDIETLKTIYGDKLVETVATDQKGRSFPIYKITNIPLTGADGEEFLVDITLDSSTYATIKEGEAIKNPVNSLTKPEFSSLFGSDVIMLFKQYTRPDNQLESYFRAEGVLTDSELAQLKPGKVKKSTNMIISCNYTGSLYNYTIQLEMTYTYDGDPNKSVTVQNTVSKTYAEKEGHSIYFLLTPFDNVSTSLGADASGSYYSSDKLNISYMYTGGLQNKPILGLFLAEQYVSNRVDSSKLTCMDSKNITYDVTTNLYAYNNDSNTMKMYTNIKNRDGGSEDNILNLTESKDLVDTRLFGVTVDVKYDGDVIATFAGSKEE